MKDPEERYAVLKKRLQERNLEERGYLMDCQRGLQGTLKPVMASNEKMTRDIIGDLTHVTEGLQEINGNLEAKKELLRIVAPNSNSIC